MRNVNIIFIGYLTILRQLFLQSYKYVFCHSEPFTTCHSERSEESIRSAQDKLREESNIINTIQREILRLAPQNDKIQTADETTVYDKGNFQLWI